MFAGIQCVNGLAGVERDGSCKTDRINLRVVEHLSVVGIQPEPGLALPILQRIRIGIAKPDQRYIVSDRLSGMDKRFSPARADYGKADWMLGFFQNMNRSNLNPGYLALRKISKEK